MFRLSKEASNTEASSNTAITNTNFHYIAITFDRDGLARFYLDRAPDGTADISSMNSLDITNNAAEDGFNIGQIGSHLARFYFNGLIDDVRIYNRVLSADEINRLYNMGR